MAVPTYITGQVLAASDCNTWFTPVVAIKPSDQTVTSSTVLVNDTALVIPVAANRTYEIWLEPAWTPVNSSNTPGMQFDFTAPASATLNGRYIGQFGATGGVVTNNYQMGTPQLVGDGATGIVSVCAFHGLLVVAATAGNLQFKWAQQNSSATSTVMKAGSFLVARAVA